VASAGPPARRWLTRLRLTRLRLTRLGLTRVGLTRLGLTRVGLTWLRLTWLGRACLLTAAAASVAGCVNMPDSGPMGAISPSPQSTAAGGDFFEPFLSGPSPNEDPGNIVNGFLAASASYPVNAAIAREYLLSSAIKKWNPGWSATVFSSFNVSDVTPAAPPRVASRQAEVDASGTVQSSFNGSGQFVSVAKNDTTSGWHFNLTKVNGQWRIANPPPIRLLTVPQFTQFYRAQDLYFVNPSIAGLPNQALVPAAVFVPQFIPPEDLVANLVNALLPVAGGQPNSTWLNDDAAVTFPAGTRLGSVALDGTTAVVNLTGLAGATIAVKEQVSAQLAWTLASPRAGPPPAIQSVELELNGKAWTPPSVICGIRQSRSVVQNQATYPCYNPYPSQSASFSFTDHGHLWSRCGREADAQHGLVGPVVSVFHPASPASAQPCSGNIPTASLATPESVSLPAKNGTPSMVAVSPDGDYVAYYSPDKKEVFAGPSSSAGDLPQVQGGVGSGVTALGWDRNDSLWMVQNGDVYMMQLNGKATQVTSAPPDVTALSVAPDGVRIALVVQDGSASEVELAAIIHGGQSSQVHLGSSAGAVSLGGPVPIGRNLVQPDALTWYDADNLIVLEGSTDKTLAEVPVDGQDSSSPQLAPGGAISITADGGMNALVAGLSSGQLAVSTGLEGPWQSLAVQGQNPAYPG
jgi:hypothetical protein